MGHACAAEQESGLVRMTAARTIGPAGQLLEHLATAVGPPPMCCLRHPLETIPRTIPAAYVACTCRVHARRNALIYLIDYKNCEARLREERARGFDWDRSADHIRARSQNDCTLEAGYMTAPVSFREKVRFFSLAPRAPSIHDPKLT